MLPNLKSVCAGLIGCALTLQALADPLPSWREGDNKNAILEFVTNVTNPESDQFVPVASRIATFDNDGTLWTEQPVYFQLIYALDMLKEQAKKDPSILDSTMLKAAVDGDFKTLMSGGKGALQEVINASHADISLNEFEQSVKQWLATARHPKTNMPYNAMVYQPMLELLSYLRDKGFTTYIVSGGGQMFVRAFAQDTYGIPPQQVIGSGLHLSYEVINGNPQLTKKPDIAFLDDGPGKPVGIATIIGKKPIFVAGNSDGDFEMLEWGSTNSLPSLGVIVHHTDAKREYQYDRDSHIGKLDKGLSEAGDRGWLLIDMKEDWAKVYPKTP
ncbi:HAD family hydrolase [Gilvimarinus agarilyticus]|uniref:HAD family hydrolase n=1 Tax=Gilvimarinus agarilyticus TaxID=679259 RepID=UPI00069675FB|nr:HAD family hydrolase [Gilvimarinus agarilyticus]